MTPTHYRHAREGMATTPRTRTILEHLLPRSGGEQTNVFAVLDCARDYAIYREMKRWALDYESLFSGQLRPALREVSPHIVRLAENDVFTQYFIEEGWGRSWGICVAGRTSRYHVRRHLRTLLRVRDSGGRYLLFRFYDPRVLSVFMPTCNLVQLDQMFGPLVRWDLEGSTGEHLLRFKMSSRAGARQLESQTFRLPELEG